MSVASNPADRRPLIVIPDDIVGAYSGSPRLSALQPLGSVRVFSDKAGSEQELGDRISDASAVISFRPAFTRFTAAILQRCPFLRILSVSGTGLGDVDLDAAGKARVAVANVPGPSNRAVAEHALALILDVARSITLQDRAIRDGKWQSLQGIELAGRTIGLVGMGGIAQELAGIASALGMKVLSWSRNNDAPRAASVGAEPAELADLLGASDVVSMHLNLNKDTAGIADARFFAAMKAGAIFINTARGKLVDEAALVGALKNGHLRGAGLDVFNAEPPTADDPIRSMPNVVMTPVGAWNTSDASDRMIAVSIENVLRFFDGSPQNVAPETRKF